MPIIDENRLVPIGREQQPGSIDESRLVPTGQEQVTEQGFLGSIGERLGERVGSVAEFAERQAEGSAAKGAFRAPAIAAVGLGQAAGGVLDIAGETAIRAIKAFTPKPVKQFAKETAADILQTPLGRTGIKAFQAGGSAYESFKSRYPDSAIAVESAANLIGLPVGGKAAKLTAGEISNIGKDVSRIVGRGKAATTDKAIDALVKHGITKAIRPKRVKGAFSLTDKSFKDASNAIKTIVRNKENLSFVDDAGNIITGVIPENLSQMAQGLEQTKRNIFSLYDDIATSTAEKVSTESTVSKLKNLLESKPKRIAAGPGFKARIETLVDRLERGPMTAKEAQETIAEFNARLASFHANPSVRAKGIIDVDNVAVIELRKALSATILGSKGPRFNELRKQYGALASLEDDVGKALHRDMVRARVSFGDLVTNLSSGTQMAYAVATQNAALAAASIASKGIGTFSKLINNPNRAVRSMFNNVEKVMQFEPKSIPGKAAVKAIDFTRRQ